MLGSRVPDGSSDSVWPTLTPIPQITAPRDDSSRIPPTFASPTSTSFGHLSVAASPAVASTASATASPTTSESCSTGRPAEGRSSSERSNERPATSLHPLPDRPRPPVWCSVTATAPSGSSRVAERVLGRGALLAPEVGPAETAAEERLHAVCGQHLVFK